MHPAITEVIAEIDRMQAHGPTRFGHLTATTLLDIIEEECDRPTYLLLSAHYHIQYAVYTIINHYQRGEKENVRPSTR
jgi:hypothetical protein